MIIKLNGLLHTDDKLALKDIKRQLKLAECCDWTSFSSFQENLIYVFEKLKDKKIENAQPCILFILDEFHLFCGHKKQLLLYNLFDVIRSTKATICVIGMTYSTDIKELLEKRILSRFSDRIIWLDHSTTINERLTMFKNICTLSKEDLPGIEKM